MPAITNLRFIARVDHGDHVEATFENGTHISVDALVGATDRPTARCFAATDRGRWASNDA
jgi:hypothetical protein